MMKMPHIQAIPFKYFVLLIVVLLLYDTEALAQKYRESKHIGRSFKVTPSTTVDITNKYGKIHIMPWNNDSVEFEIDIQVGADDPNKLKNLMANIDVDFVATQYYVTAKTNFGEDDFWNQLIETFIPSESHVVVDYTIRIPNYVNLKLDNKYGDVYVDDVKGEFHLKLSNGDFKANSLTGDSDIELVFGNGNINKMNTGRLLVSYAELTIKEAEQINLNTKSVKMTVDKVNVMNIKSKRDKCYIQQANYLYGESYFSDIWVYDLSQEVSLNTRYGEVNLENIRKSFTFINMDSHYTDLKFIFQKGAAYHLDITHQKVDIELPSDYQVSKKAVVNQKDKYITYGKIGPAAKAKVRIKMQGNKLLIR